ncbi:MAG: tyrosine recombinase XerC [Burkholderiaceae bacterium]
MTAQFSGNTDSRVTTGNNGGVDSGGPAGHASQIRAYLECLLSQRHLSALTVVSYGRDLNELLELLGGDGRLQKESPRSGTAAVPAFIDVSHFHIRRFASQLHARGLSARSIARKLSAWRGFFDWLSESTTLACNPVDGVKAPKRGKPLPKALSADDAVRLVATAAPVRASSAVHHDITGAGMLPVRSLLDTASRACNRAMFELLYSSGLRVSELVGLDLRYGQDNGNASAGWIDFDAHDVTVTGKGNKKRCVPVGQAAITALNDWVGLRQTIAKADIPALFVNSRGKRMSIRSVQLRLKYHAQAVGIPVDVHPHVLRHSFASHVLQSSGDLRAVQEMLGHASITSTQIYTSLDFQRLAQVYDAAHPRARKKS